MLRRKKRSEHLASLWLQQKIEDGTPLFINGIILQEVLQGIRSTSHYQAVKTALRDFDFLATTPEIHEQAAEIFNRCQQKGITCQTIDSLIAAQAIEHDCALLTTDEDFQFIARHFPLELVAY